MKRILFVIPEYSHGGTNKSLENLLTVMDNSHYDISIYSLYEDGGEYYKKVFAPYIIKKSCLYYWLHDNVVTRKVMGLYNKMTRRSNFTFLYKYEANRLQNKYGFDSVVAFQEGTATDFVSFMKNIPNRIAWIHCDYGAWANTARIKSDQFIYQHFNHIVCVSESARHSFISIFPELNNKAHSINNLLNIQVIKKLANVFENANENEDNKENIFTVVSVGRLNSVKQFENIPGMVHEIKKNVKVPFRWYILGSGASETEIREEIAKYNLQEVVLLLGAKDNPYPYMKQADLVVCTSSSESFSYVLAEAKVLHTPILSNDFPVAYEVVEDSTGWIANIKEMPQVLARIIDNVDGEYESKKSSVMRYEYSNHDVLQKIDMLFCEERAL